MFKLLKKSKKSHARLTELKTAHGTLMGPFFMPIATRGAVKNLTADEMKDLKAQIVLANTYHLMLNPGEKLVKKAGGLHQFMNWDGPILTDSGGFQVFSLSKIRKIEEKGVTFSDPKTGKKYFLTPEKSMQIQSDLGVDITMAFDDVIGYPASKKKVEESMERTTRWAKRCLESREQKIKKIPMPALRDRDPDFVHSASLRANVGTRNQLLFGIIQGGIHRDLRLKSAHELTCLGFDGYAVGGVAVGESREKMKQILDWVMPILPENKPRYLMGLGKPEEIIEAVKQGIDMFDCVIPTREARHGRLYLWKPTAYSLQPTSYQTINITNAKYAKDLKPINNTNLKQYSKAYLHHLFRTSEPLSMRLATLNNLNFYLTLMTEIRRAIKTGKL